MPQTIFEAYNLCKKRLLAAGIDDEVFEAKQIIKHITGMTSAQIISNYNAQLTEFQQNMLTAVIHQREAHYPLQYIFGVWSFYGRDFEVGAGVLIPRADTEVLAGKALEIIKETKNPAVLDLPPSVPTRRSHWLKNTKRRRVMPQKTLRTTAR